ncbi:MAG: glycosyltransferase [Phycisphaerales bacterium]
MTATHSSSNAITSAPHGGGGHTFNGVICFGGEDWWYHNRGHYDMQMMREMSRRVPVLYVNSIGMRVPRVTEGRMFVTRVRRKLESLRRGLIVVRKNFAVFSPVAAPGRAGRRMTRVTLPIQVLRAAGRFGISRPLVWVACPPAIEAAPRLRPVGLVYQRTDRFEEFSGVDPDLIRRYDRRLKSTADLTLFCASHLYEREADACRRAAYVDHGVDFERFAAAGRAIDAGDTSVEPADVRDIPRPRVGFIGGIDSHTFDPALFVAVATRLPHVQFVMVGGCSLADGWCDLPNVRLLGQRPYEEVAGYMASCDVLIMPWNENDWIRACNPVKLKEYLAAGRPIITRPFDELRNYAGYVRIASSPDEFAAAIRRALDSPDAPERLRARVERSTWSDKSNAALSALQAAGLAPIGNATSASDAVSSESAAPVKALESFAS